MVSYKRLISYLFLSWCHCLCPHSWSSDTGRKLCFWRGTCNSVTGNCKPQLVSFHITMSDVAKSNKLDFTHWWRKMLWALKFYFIFLYCVFSLRNSRRNNLWSYLDLSTSGKWMLKLVCIIQDMDYCRSSQGRWKKKKNSSERRTFITS